MKDVFYKILLFTLSEFDFSILFSRFSGFSDKSVIFGSKFSFVVNSLSFLAKGYKKIYTFIIVYC